MIKVYTGRIIEQDYREAVYILFLEGNTEPLAEIVARDLYHVGNYVSVSYFISAERKTKAQLEDSLIRVLSGDLEAEYTDHYSDLTGYLWTDENLIVGGHNLIEEFRSYLGKYLYLEITYHGSKEQLIR